MPTVSYCLSRAPIFPAGKHVHDTRNHAAGGLGHDSVEAGINLEMDEGKGALLCPSPGLAPGCSGTNELPMLENPMFGGLMARACTVLIKWHRLFSLETLTLLRPAECLLEVVCPA